MRVAWLGLGRMGAPMAAHVVRAGHDVTVWNRTAGRAGDLVGLGARETGSIAEAVDGAGVVVLMLYGPDAVREVLGELVQHAPQGTLVVDATTVAPEDAREFAGTAAAAGLRWVDAPVFGTVTPAREGTLGVVAGGSEQDYAEAEPLLHLWGDPARVRRAGEVGTGSATKVTFNLGLGVAMAGVGESLRVADTLGLDRGVVLDLLAGGPFGWSVKQKRPMLDSGDFSATTFSVGLLAKDLDLAVRAAGGALPVTAAARDEARAAAGDGHAEDDYAALADWLARPDR